MYEKINGVKLILYLLIRHVMITKDGLVKQALLIYSREFSISFWHKRLVRLDEDSLF